MGYVKERTEGFDDYYPCMKKKDFYCGISYVHKLMILFVFQYNTVTKPNVKLRLTFS
jgi:hypothetical protein